MSETTFWETLTKPHWDLLDFSSLPMVASRWMNTRAWSCYETSWQYRHLSCGTLCTCRLRVFSNTWGIHWFLRFIYIRFHVVLGSASWIIWIWNGNLISSKIQFLHSFNQFKRLRHVPKQIMAKETLLEPHASRRVRNDMKSLWVPKCNLKTCANKDICWMFFLQHPQWFLPLFFIGFEVWDTSPTFQKQQLSWLYFKFGSPFLSKGFVHSWWFRIKLSRHSWLLDAEFHLSICTRLALSEPVLPQCSSGGIRWHTLEVCRL